MDHEGERLPDGSTATIEDELRNWPRSVHSEVAEAEAQGQLARQSHTQQAANRRRVFWAALALLFIACAITIPVLWTSRREATVRPSTTAAAPPPAGLQNTQLSVGPTGNSEYYKKTEASVTAEGREILRVVQYDFYAGKFIVDNTTLQNERTIISTFENLREQLKDSWVVIFASASLDGYEDYNLDLCRRRLYAVRDLLAKDAGISARGYWGIIAGEFKIDLPGVPPERREDEENRIAQDRGKVWLSDQRRLIVITIRETTPLAAEERERVPFAVAKHVYEQGMLPKNYDAPNSTPFPLTSGNGTSQDATPSRSPTR